MGGREESEKRKPKQERKQKGLKTQISTGLEVLRKNRLFSLENKMRKNEHILHFFKRLTQQKVFKHLLSKTLVFIHSKHLKIDKGRVEKLKLRGKKAS